MHLDFGYCTIAAERTRRTIRLRQRHHEVVHPAEPALDLPSVRLRDGDSHGRHFEGGGCNSTASAATAVNQWHYPGLLQYAGIINPRSDTLQIACHRVARRALPLEISLPSLWVAHHNTRRTQAPGIAARYAEVVNKGSDIGEVGG